MNSRKYKILVDFPDRGWKAGEVVEVVGAKEVNFEVGTLELCPSDTPHRHCLMAVNALKLKPVYQPIQ